MVRRVALLATASRAARSTNAVPARPLLRSQSLISFRFRRHPICYRRCSERWRRCDGGVQMGFGGAHDRPRRLRSRRNHGGGGVEGPSSSPHSEPIRTVHGRRRGGAISGRLSKSPKIEKSISSEPRAVSRRPARELSTPGLRRGSGRLSMHCVTGDVGGWDLADPIPDSRIWNLSTGPLPDAVRNDQGGDE